MNVTVTGGAGFIGANVVRILLDAGTADHVTVVDDLSTGSRANLAGIDRCELIEGSVLDPPTLDAAFRGADAVVHLAARPSVPRSLDDPIASHRANASGTLEVLEAVRRAGRPHTIVASSSSVYGTTPTLPKHEDLAPAPRSPYAASKLATEAYALAYGHSFEVPVLVFRFFNVFGPFQPAGHAYAAVIPTFISAALAGNPLPVHGDGRQTRDFTFVGSVASVIADAINRRITCTHPVNLAFGSRRDLLTVVAALEAVLDERLEIDHQPPRPGDVRHSQADQRRLRSLFPEVAPVEFETGLQTTVDWMRSADRPARSSVA